MKTIAIHQPALANVMNVIAQAAVGPPSIADVRTLDHGPAVGAHLQELSRRRARSRATHRGKRGRPISR